MDNEYKLNKLSQDNNGIITYKELLDSGFTKRNINIFVKEDIIDRVSKGIYVHNDYLRDDLKINQIQNNNLIYSHETASYLHELTDRYPSTFSATTYSGYHLRNSKSLKMYYTKKETLLLGVINIKSNAGNYVKVYDKERTICDLIKYRDRIDQQIYYESIQNYFKSKTNLNKLSKYATILGIKEELYDIINLMMKQ